MVVVLLTVLVLFVTMVYGPIAVENGPAGLFDRMPSPDT